MSDRGFLSRWSRRKREAAPVKETAADAPPSAIRPLSAEEIASLPPPEQLTATSDLAQFLREGVPAVLRNAALRRIWALDPAIRDFVGDARDYAYDWNIPGGVPGSEPLLAAEDAERLLRRIIGEPRGEDGAPASGEGPGEASAEDEPAAAPRHHGGAMPV